MVKPFNVGAKKRRCLGPCRKMFNSTGPGNRFCGKCDQLRKRSTMRVDGAHGRRVRKPVGEID